MNKSRNSIPLLLLALVAVVGGGFALLGYHLSKSNPAVPVKTAVTNTLNAGNYNESVTETAQGQSETDTLAFQAPDKLGGYVDRAKQRTYIYILGAYAYQSLAASATTPLGHLVFYKQATTQSAQATDPASVYLPYVNQAKAGSITQNGNVATFSIVKTGQTGHFSYTVSGKYISQMSLKVGSSSVLLILTNIGSAKAPALPAGVKISVLPTSSTSSAG